MAIRQITPDSEIEEYLEEQIRLREQVIINVLNRVGMECISEARTNGSYLDQTGNLRSSIGYAVLNDGKVVNKSLFDKVKSGSEGKQSGNDFIKSLANRYSRDIVLIVVAGMDYAAHVETRRNVLTSSEILASRLVPKLLKQLGFTGK